MNEQFTQAAAKGRLEMWPNAGRSVAKADSAMA